MRPTPTNSFFHFVLGFLVFISVFFGITIGVNSLATTQAAQAQAAAAEALMLK